MVKGLGNLRPTLAMLDTRTAFPAAKQADAFYSGREYLAWREAVIARANGVCEATECNRAEPRMFADHIAEVRDGGAKYDIANGQCLCGSCHSRKTAREKRRRIEAQSPFAPR
jgi:5-methylcytosine-specific restriction enzyme A